MAFSGLPGEGGASRGAEPGPGEGEEERSGHVRLVACGHVTGGGAQAPRLGVLLRERRVKWGDAAAATMVSARRPARPEAPAGPWCARGGSQRRARRRACREGARSGEA